MSKSIVIATRDFEVEASLLEEERPRTCDEIWDALPIDGRSSVYKEEVYFHIPVEIEPEDATQETKRGDVSYWPDGPGFCIFFGDSQPVSPVNTFARIQDGVEKFRGVEEGDEISVRKA